MANCRTAQRWQIVRKFTEPEMFASLSVNYLRQRKIFLMLKTSDDHATLDGERTKEEHIDHITTDNFMLDNLASDQPSESERLDVAADQAIAACDGNMRSTIRALILANEFLEYELCEMFKAVTNGQARGKISSTPSDWFD